MPNGPFSWSRSHMLSRASRLPIYYFSNFEQTLQCYNFCQYYVQLMIVFWLLISFCCVSRFSSRTLPRSTADGPIGLSLLPLGKRIIKYSLASIAFLLKNSAPLINRHHLPNYKKEFSNLWQRSSRV